LLKDGGRNLSLFLNCEVRFRGAVAAQLWHGRQRWLDPQRGLRFGFGWGHISGPSD